MLYEIIFHILVLLLIPVALAALHIISTGKLFRGAADAGTEQPPPYEHQLAASFVAAGTVTAIHEIRAYGPRTTDLHSYQIAVTYRRDGEELTALMGFDSDVPTALTEGSKVRLHVFSSAVAEQNQDAWQRARAASGGLPADPPVHFRSAHGVTIDETATVMFEEDYETYRQAEADAYRPIQNTQQTIEKGVRLTGSALIVIGILVLLLILCFFGTVLRELVSFR